MHVFSTITPGFVFSDFFLLFLIFLKDFSLLLLNFCQKVHSEEKERCKRTDLVRAVDLNAWTGLALRGAWGRVRERGTCLAYLVCGRKGHRMVISCFFFWKEALLMWKSCARVFIEDQWLCVPFLCWVHFGLMMAQDACLLGWELQAWILHSYFCLSIFLLYNAI